MGMLASALAWAARGFRVFPLPVNVKGPPFWKNWPAAATTDQAQITTWWRDELTGIEHAYNIGVCTSGIVVLDLDNKDGKDGQSAYEALGGAFDTLTVRTPTGGYHLYYRTARAAGQRPLAPGVDVRGENGYVLAPGSRRPEGTYELLFDAPVAELPAHLLALTSVPGAPLSERPRGPAAELDTPSALASVRAYLRTAPPAVQGLNGNDRAYQTACEVRDRGASEGRALELLLEGWNERCSPPWPVEELRPVVESAFAHAQNQEGSKSPEALFDGIVIVPPEPAPIEGASGTWVWGNLPEEKDIPPRPWVVHELLLRGDVTALLAPGGVGKSLTILQVAISLALGAPRIFGFQNALAGTPAYSMIYNAEDSMEEMALRVHAICRHLGVSAAAVRPYLSLSSGKRRAVRLAAGRDMPHPNEAEIELFLRAAAERHPALVALDPLSKLHDSPENDNTAMGRVLDILAALGSKMDAPILLGHHTPKMNGASHAGSAGAGRGASNIIDSTRIAWTLETMTTVDAAQFGVRAEDRRYYLRLDNARAGRTLGGDPAYWLKRVPFRMSNGDQVGVLVDADLAGRQATAYQDYAEAVVNWCREADRSTMGFAEAVEMLRRQHSALAEMPVTAVSAHLDGVFGPGARTGSGELVRLGREGAKKVLAWS